MGQLAPLLQLAVKVFKFSRFHTCMVCQLGRIAKCLNAMETNKKENKGSHKGLEVRQRVHWQFDIDVLRL